MGQKELWDSKWSKLEKDAKTSEPFTMECLEWTNNNKSKILLDVGCGLGSDTIFFSKKFRKIIAVDFSKEAIKILDSRLKELKIQNVETLCEDCRNLNFEENSIDIVYANVALHYFSDNDTRKIFQNLYRILKIGGLVFVRCKSVNDFLYGIGNKLGENYYENEQTRHFFSKEYIEDVANMFQIKKLEYEETNHLQLDGSYAKSSFVMMIAKK